MSPVCWFGDRRPRRLLHRRLHRDAFLFGTGGRRIGGGLSDWLVGKITADDLSEAFTRLCDEILFGVVADKPPGLNVFAESFVKVPLGVLVGLSVVLLVERFDEDLAGVGGKAGDRTFALLVDNGLTEPA